MRSLFVLFAAASLVGCGGGLSRESQMDVENSTRATALALQHLASGSIEYALTLAAHCADQAVIRNERLPTIDSGLPCP